MSLHYLIKTYFLIFSIKIFSGKKNIEILFITIFNIYHYNSMEETSVVRSDESITNGCIYFAYIHIHINNENKI